MVVESWVQILMFGQPLCMQVLIPILNHLEVQLRLGCTPQEKSSFTDMLKSISKDIFIHYCNLNYYQKIHFHHQKSNQSNRNIMDLELMLATQ